VLQRVQLITPRHVTSKPASFREQREVGTTECSGQGPRPLPKQVLCPRCNQMVAPAPLPTYLCTLKGADRRRPPTSAAKAYLLLAPAELSRT
jgi:hypothetical protein